MSRQSICGKCKTAQLPRHLAVHVKVGDDYKIVCILQAWEIKRLATTVQWRLPADAGAYFLFLILFSLPPLTPPAPLSSFFLLFGEKNKAATMAHKSYIYNTQAVWHLVKSLCSHSSEQRVLCLTLLHHVGCNFNLLKRLKVSSDNPPCLSCWHSSAWLTGANTIPVSTLASCMSL